jgi:hypothetical protein
MDTLITILVVLFGAALRLLVPLALTALVVIALRRLDVRWQAEAEQEQKMLLKGETPCFKEQGISIAEIKVRLAGGERPCWQTHRLSNGHLREECLDCEVFLDAPMPAPRQHAHV